MLVWRTTSRDEIFYQWSSDGGQSWKEPAIVPELFARSWDTPFDRYDMATDSAGQIHLIVVGRRTAERDARLGVYHLSWDGENWSPPQPIFSQRGLYPEYPRLVIHEGNRLHAAWFTRAGNIWDSAAERQVWYAAGHSGAPPQPVTPLPTLTPEPTATAFASAPTPVPTPYPTLPSDGAGLPGGLDTDSDDVLRLILALSPVAAVILVVMAIRLGWFDGSRR